MENVLADICNMEKSLLEDYASSTARNNMYLEYLYLYICTFVINLDLQQ